MTKVSFWLGSAAITIVSFILRFLIGPNPRYGAGHDDELMVRTANFLTSGEWAGPYDQIGHIGLSKPIGYPLFLAAIQWIPVSPVDIVHLMLLLGIMFLLRELSVFGLGRRLSLVLYAIFAFYPPLFNESISRIYRDGFLGALTVLILGLSLMHKRKFAQSKKGLKYSFDIIGIGLLIGLMVGLFAITKNTWHYIFILLLIILLSPFSKIVKERRIKKVLVSSSIVLIPVLVGLLPILLFVTGKNHQNYGVRLIDTYSYGSFPTAMKSIYSVKDNQDRPFVDVTKDMRAAIYEVSPTFFKPKEFLELPDNEGWRKASCSSSMAVCDESAAWFPWDLRDAVQSAGLGDTAAEFEDSFSKIHSEIDRACSQKRIECDSKGIAPGLDSLGSLSPRIFINAATYGVAELLKPGSGYGPRPTSVDPNISLDQVGLWQSVVNRLPAPTFSSSYEVQGFFLSDLRQSLINIYETFWIPLILLATLGYVLSFRRNWHIFIISSIVLSSIAALILQLSLLEASSGVYMIPGAELYLICLIPLVFAFITLGLTQLLRQARAITTRN